VGLRPVAISGSLRSGFIRSVGVARASLLQKQRMTMRSATKSSAVTVVFERELEAIVHDAAFSGLEIVAHHARPVRGATALSVTIDRFGGADLALCERVATRLNAQLATIDAGYTLQVESAGLERPLVRAGDYERFAGERVRIVSSLTVNGGKTHRGILRGLRRDAVVIENDSGELLLPLAAIKSANLEYDPRADLKRDKLQRKQRHGNNRKYGN
jgi:ribosome maturation factor RimP